jgi:hypothetical protein
MKEKVVFVKKITSKIILLCSGIFAAFFTAEIVIRCFSLAPVMLDYNIMHFYHFTENPKICYRIKPFASSEINSEGFRGEEFTARKDENSVRIIMLGDSITYGSFVKRSETFSDVLEKTLIAKSRLLPLPKRYEVMNFGIPGYNIVSEIEVLKVFGLKYKPDIVVLNYFWNDNEAYSFNYWNFLQRHDIAPAEKNWAYQYYLNPDRFRWKRLFLKSHLFAYFWALTHNLRESFLEFNNIEYEKYKNDIVRDKLIDLRQMGVDNNFKVLICMHPILDYDRNEPHPNYAKTKKIAEELEISCFDLTRYYTKQSADPRKFLVTEKDTYHPNPAGHRLIAHSLQSELEKAGYIGKY